MRRAPARRKAIRSCGLCAKREYSKGMAHTAATLAFLDSPDAAQPGQNGKTDFAREGVSYLSARTVVRLCIENLGMQKAF